MTEISGQVVNVIKEAIKLEINGRGFFNHATEVTHNELGKKMFRKLAQDETEHLDSFGNLFTALTGGEEWRKLVDPDEVKGDSNLIDELNSRMKKGERASELEAISIGMELERNAVDFFEKSAREATDPKAREILEKICEEEKFHYELLQAQYDSVNNSGFWLDSAEFRMDGRY
ncbi:MAG: ferritin family protein [Candidatus Zixiibacteriota bacterium]